MTYRDDEQTIIRSRARRAGRLAGRFQKRERAAAGSPPSPSCTVLVIRCWQALSRLMMSEQKMPLVSDYIRRPGQGQAATRPSDDHCRRGVTL